MASYRIIIYDCDGVLFDSRESNRAFYNHILEKFGLPAMGQDQLDFVHASTAEQAIDFLFADDPRREEAQRYRLSMDYKPFVPLMKMEPHVREVLRALKSKCWTALATNRGLTMPIVIREHGLDGLFDMVVTSLDVKEPKPHPECIQKILHRFKLVPSEALYVGDSEVDRLVAEKAKVDFASYRNPSLDAKYHLHDHLDILEIVDGARTKHTRR